VAVLSPNNIIGGTTAAARNVISGNDGFGVAIMTAQASGNLVEGNYVGSDASGMTAIGLGTATGVLPWIVALLPAASLGMTTLSAA